MSQKKRKNYIDNIKNNNPLMNVHTLSALRCSSQINFCHKKLRRSHTHTELCICSTFNCQKGCVSNALHYFTKCVKIDFATLYISYFSPKAASNFHSCIWSLCRDFQLAMDFLLHMSTYIHMCVCTSVYVNKFVVCKNIKCAYYPYDAKINLYFCLFFFGCWF